MVERPPRKAFIQEEIYLTSFQEIKDSFLAQDDERGTQIFRIGKIQGLIERYSLKEEDLIKLGEDLPQGFINFILRAGIISQDIALTAYQKDFNDNLLKVITKIEEQYVV